MAGKLSIIRSLNFDRSVRKTWPCSFIRNEGQRLEFVGKFNDDISHPELGFIRRGTVSYEYYWLNRWYNIFRFHEHTGEFRNFYCNVNMPPTFDGNVLEYVDLDLDLLVWPDYSFSVLDRNEFEANSLLFNFPQVVKSNAEKALAELISFAQSGEFPGQ